MLNVSKRFARETVQVEEAQRRMSAFIKELPMEACALQDSYGRVISIDVVSSHPLPHFRRSGMDGFAIRSIDVSAASAAHPIILEIIEEIPCGNVPQKNVSAGKASRIMTGAMVPTGADAVIPLEMAEQFIIQGKTVISVKKMLVSGKNVSEVGSEIKEGTLILKKGERIQAGQVSVLASFGYDQVPVYRSPRIAVIATGSELLDVQESLQLGKIRNSNEYMIAALIKEMGGTPLLLGKIPDDIKLAQEMLEQAYDSADAVITSGGVSVGDYDILSDLFTQWDDCHTIFNKVAMRPGSPTTVGVINEKLLFSLSGNPGACFSGFQLFVRPILLGMQGMNTNHLPASMAFLEEDYCKIDAYTRYVRAKSYVTEGKMYVKPMGPDQSSVMVSIKESNCFMVIPPRKRKTLAGELVTILHLSNN